MKPARQVLHGIIIGVISPIMAAGVVSISINETQNINVEYQIAFSHTPVSHYNYP